MTRLDADTAMDILQLAYIDRRVDFHTLSTSEVDALISAANVYGYRKPKNANGSRARYFHAYLCRLIDAHEQDNRR